VLGPIKVEKNDFQTKREFEEKNVKISQSDAETQTAQASRSKCRLRRRSLNTGTVMVQTFARVSLASSQVKATILQHTSKAGIIRDVGRTVSQLTAEINASLPTAPSLSQLATLQSLLSSCGSIISPQGRTAVTETCSNLLSSIIKTANCSLLSSTLSLLVLAWSDSLLDQDITAYILSLLSELIKTVKSLSSHLSSLLMNSIFSLVLLISKDPGQTNLLCKQSQDCFLSCVSLLLHMSLTKEQEVQMAACKGLVRWLLGCSTAYHTITWMENSCRWCTGDIMRALTLTTQGQVKQQMDNTGHEDDKQLAVLLGDCVTALTRLQDNLRSDQGEDTEWIKVVEVAASVQRKYIWAVEHLRKVDIGDLAALKLQNLTMETDMGPEGERGEPMET